MLPVVHLNDCQIPYDSTIIGDVPARIENRFVYTWSGDDFPSVNLLSVVSTLHHHPSSEVFIYLVGEKPSGRWFSELEQLRRVTIIEISAEEVFLELPQHLQMIRETYDNLSPTAYSAKSNILRYALLYLHGGVYLDFDVFVVRPMDALLELGSFIGKELVWADDETRLQGRRNVYLAPRNIAWALSHCVMWVDSHVLGGHLRSVHLLQRSFRFWARPQMNNAVLGAHSGCPFIEELLCGAMGADTTVRYATGPTLVDTVARCTQSNVALLPMNDFYAVPPGQTYRLFHDRTMTLPESAYLVHYAASNHPRFMQMALNEFPTHIPSRTVIGSLLHELESILTSLSLQERLEQIDA